MNERRVVIRRRAPRLALLATLTALAGCYVGPGDEGLDAIITLKVDSTADLRADGSSVVQLLVGVDPDTDPQKAITVTTSSGVLDFSADPTSADARKVTLANAGGDGELKVPLRVGREPGTTLLSASLVGVRAEATLQLGVALPAELQIAPGQTAIAADGSNKLQVQLQALSGQSSQYSKGLLARIAVCCDLAGAPVGCTELPPLTAPGSVALADDGTASFELLSRPWEAKDQTPQTIWLLAQITDDDAIGTADLCTTSTPTSARRAQSAVLVSPPAASP